MPIQTETPIKIAILEEAISKAANVSIELMHSHRRDRELAEARMAVWFIAHDHLNFSFLKLAAIYQRDHTTIISGVRKMRSKKASEQILEGIRKVCPQVFEIAGPGEPRTVENWRF